MAKQKPYHGQIPEQKNFFGKRYFYHTHSQDTKVLDNAIADFKKVYGEKYSFHATTQMVTPPGSSSQIKMHVLYSRQK